MSEYVEAASAPIEPGICGEKARLENNLNIAEDAFNTARTELRQKVGKLSKTEFLSLDRAVDETWARLQNAMREFATHIRAHGCGAIKKAPPTRSIW
jgi:hypothetical protein